jgi:ubiquinone/menaquinone biosynthesis C-methylase UbiE
VKLNQVEKALMNNPVRSILQRFYEGPLLERLGGRVEGKRVLEVGCGRGVGTEIIFERFGAREVHAIDLDPDMVDQARRRLSAYLPDRLKLSVGDVAAIEAEDESFDAVFDFGIIHHVPEWQHAVSEIRRVLKAGGRFFFEEVTTHALNRWFYRTFLEHPTENRFSGEEFVAELERQGIIVEGDVVERFFGDFIVGVGCRLHSLERCPVCLRKYRAHQVKEKVLYGNFNQAI